VLVLLLRLLLALLLLRLLLLLLSLLGPAVALGCRAGKREAVSLRTRWSRSFSR
jgi:hypothetical protein